MSKLVVPGLAIFCITSGLGLFLQQGLASPFLIPWLAGYVMLVFVVSYLALFSKELSRIYEFILLGVIGLNFVIQITGGAASPFAPAYFLLVAVALFQPGTRAYSVPAIVLAIEAANLLRSAPLNTIRWQAYAGFAVALLGIVFIIAPYTKRIRNHARMAQERYKQLLAAANAVDPLSQDKKTEALSEENRQAKNVSIGVERDSVFRGLISMIYEMIPAHTYALFLSEHEEDVFTLRAIKSESRYALPINAAQITKGKGLLGISIDKNQPQYISDKDIPSKNLGYYAHEVALQSLFLLPIMQKERMVGVLVVDSLEQDAFSPDNQDLLVRFAPFFSQIIEKIRISQELDLRARNFAALHEISSTLSSSLEIHEVLDTMISQVRSVVPFDFCAFLHYDEKSGQAVITALRGYEPHLQGSAFPLEQSAILKHMHQQWIEHRSARIHYNPDLGDRGRDISLFPFREMQKPLKSLFGRPLVSGDKFIGAAFLSSVRPNAFTDFHCSFLDTLLNQVSMVFDNSLLHNSIKNMARTDGLTGLLNHRTFMEKLHDEYKRLERDPRPFSILLVDIDFFKRVNDTYGHPIGDVALARVASALKDVVRGSDFVARYGGEEFAVGMVDADSRGAHQIAERVRKIVENTTVIVGRVEFKVTLSIGVASFPVDTKKVEDLIGLADEALYHAKRTGRNRVCLYKDAKDAEPALTKQ